MKMTPNAFGRVLAEDIEFPGRAPQHAPLTDFPTLAEHLEEKLKEMFPQSYVQARYTDNLCDSVVMRFALEPKEAWPWKMPLNSSYLMLHIFPTVGQREKPGGNARVSTGSCWKLPALRAYKAPVPALFKYIIKHFTTHILPLYHAYHDNQPRP